MADSVTETLNDIKTSVQQVDNSVQRAAATAAAFDKGVMRVVDVAQKAADAGMEEYKKIQSAAAQFVDSFKALAGKGEEAAVATTGPSARETAAQIKDERVGMFAANPAGPASGRGPTDWRDRFGKAGYQQEAETAPTASPAP